MSAFNRLSETINDDRAWQQQAVGDPSAWTFSLSEDCLAALNLVVRKGANGDQQPTDFRLGEPAVACTACMEPALIALNAGLGFAIIEGVPIEQVSLAEAQAIYWLIGQYLGQPFEQNIQGTLLYDVRDTGQNVAQGARFSVTNAESSFHQDNAFGQTVPDFIGLLCLNQAKSGGQSQLISAYTLHNELLTHHPEVLETLYQIFYFDRRGQFKKGESPVSKRPILDWDGHELTMRYLHYYILVGHEKMGQPLTPAQERALATVEDLLRRPDLRVEFTLHPGQMLFTNNRWILHNRTAFEDYLEPEQRRHYVRLWLKRRA